MFNVEETSTISFGRIGDSKSISQIYSLSGNTADLSTILHYQKDFNVPDALQRK